MSTDFTLPKIVMGATASVAMLSLARSGMRRRRVLNGRGNEHLLTTRTGNVLSYRVMNSGVSRGSRCPIIVCESGLLATMEHWTWMVDAVPESAPLVLYDRAGYGRSRYRAAGPFGEETLVSDLADLISAIRGDRTVLLVGHAMGAGMVMRAAEALRECLAGAVLLEPVLTSHSDRSSEGDAAGANTVSRISPLFLRSLQLGYGDLLSTPDWTARLPLAARTLCEEQFRDSRMWQAARREASLRSVVGTVHDDLLGRFPSPIHMVSHSDADTTGVPRFSHITQHRLGSCLPGRMLLDRETAEQAAAITTEVCRLAGG